MSLSSRQDLEEERRLFYVAVTRAERNLTLSYAVTRYQYGNSSCQELSRFVEDIDSRYLDMPQASRNFPKVGDLPRAFQHVPGVKGLAETQRSFKKKEEAVKPAARHLQPKSTLTKGPTVPNSPAAINAIQVGMEVMHAKFGRGKVMNVEGSGNDRKAVVFFEGIGQKTLILAFAKLTIVE